MAAVIALPIGGGLVVAAPAGRLRLATILYACTLVAVFAGSATYHLGRWSPTVRRRLKATDHVLIFCFIAGSYGPLLVVLLSPMAAAACLIVLWVAVGAGSWTKLRSLDRLGGSADLWYAGIMWWGVLLFPVAGRLEGSAVLLYVGGNAVYSLGAAALGGRRPDPWPGTFGYHEVAHLLILGGAACHIALCSTLVT